MCPLARLARSHIRLRGHMPQHDPQQPMSRPLQQQLHFGLGRSLLTAIPGLFLAALGAVAVAAHRRKPGVTTWP